MRGTPNVNRVAGYSEYNISLLPKTGPVCTCGVRCVVGSDQFLQESHDLCSISANQIINPLQDEAQTALFKDPVRTAL